MKRIITAVTAAAMLLAAAPAAAGFADVTEYSGAYRAVTELEALGIVEGDENGNFDPYRKLTRAEFAKLIVAATGEEAVAEALTETRFYDCKGHWAAGYIEAGASKGYINGYSDGEFGPEDTVTYAQAVKMLVAALGYTMYAEAAGGWPSGYMTYGTKLGVTKYISGADNDTEITREVAAVMIDNAMKIPLAIVEDYMGNLVIYDGKGGRDYETLLTYCHDTYIVKGKIIETRLLNKGLAKGEVTYQVESSDNFDGRAYNKETEPVRMKADSVNAADMLFLYTEALVRKTDTDEYEILAITEK